MCPAVSHLRISCFCKRRFIWMALAILTPAISIAQEPTPTLAPNEFIASKADDIVGIWQSQFGGTMRYYTQYETDGTYVVASTIEDLEAKRGRRGTFSFEGTVYIQKGRAGSGSYEIRVTKEGDKRVHLSFRVIDDSNTIRVRDLTAGMNRFEPPLQTSEKLEDSPKRLDELYQVYFPKEYEEQAKTWPLLLFLHGSGQSSQPKLIEQGRKFSFIVVAPRSPFPYWAVDFLDSVLKDVVERYQVDEDRIYVTGLSMGGSGTWDLAIAYPERFAAIVPICGEGGELEQIELIKELPIWVFHNARDDVLLMERSQEMVDALKKVGSNVKFTIYPKTGHDAWTETYKNPELYEWFLQHRRGEIVE